MSGGFALFSSLVLAALLHISPDFTNLLGNVR